MCLIAAKGALDGGPEEGGAMGADSDEEEKRANRARAASKDPGSAAESRNQSVARDVCISVRFCNASVLLPADFANFLGPFAAKALSLTTLCETSACCDQTIE